MSGSALKGESLIFELKYAGSNCVESLVLKMNGKHSASEQNRRCDADGDNGRKQMWYAGSGGAHDDSRVCPRIRLRM
jgi:hypothetical protein